MKAIFTREFHWMRPDFSLGFGAMPDEKPQTFPHDFIEAAIAAGAAKAVTSDPETKAAGPAAPKTEV